MINTFDWANDVENALKVFAEKSGTHNFDLVGVDKLLLIYAIIMSEPQLQRLSGNNERRGSIAPLIAIVQKIIQNRVTQCDCDEEDANSIMGDWLSYLTDHYVQLCYKYNGPLVMSHEITPTSVKSIQSFIIPIYGGAGDTVINPNALESAMAVLESPYIDNDIDRAAHLFEKLYFAHAFIDGNKRTALLTMMYYLLTQKYYLSERTFMNVMLLDSYGDDIIEGVPHLTQIPHGERIDFIKKLFKLNELVKVKDE